MILVIDNYDSFTFNLVQMLGALRAPLVVKRNDQISLGEIALMRPAMILLSPGPGRPEQAGQLLAIIKNFAGKIPIFGVCLGMQALAQCFGGKIVTAAQVMHGKRSLIEHNQEGVFSDIPAPCSVVRYHSLIVERKSLPDCFRVTAWLNDGEQTIMGIAHREAQLEGVQFHPESILSESGERLLQNFLKYNTRTLS